MDAWTYSLKTLDLSQPSFRETLAALVPFGYVVACLLALGLQRFSPSFVSLFTQWLTVEEASQIISNDAKKDVISKAKPVHAVTTTWILISAIETAVWVAVASYNLFLEESLAFQYLIFAATWLYATVKVARSMRFPSMQLMFLYFFLFVGAVFMLVGDIYFPVVYGRDPPRRIELFAHAANVFATAVLVLCSLRSPFSPQPSQPREERSDCIASPEDSTTMWRWVTFKWANSLISEGTRRTLNEVDIYDLAITMRAWPLFSKFSKLDPSSSLLWRLFRANSQDLMYELSISLLLLCAYC